MHPNQTTAKACATSLWMVYLPTSSTRMRITTPMKDNAGLEVTWLVKMRPQLRQMSTMWMYRNNSRNGFGTASSFKYSPFLTQSSPSYIKQPRRSAGPLLLIAFLSFQRYLVLLSGSLLAPCSDGDSLAKSVQETSSEKLSNLLLAQVQLEKLPTNGSRVISSISTL